MTSFRIALLARSNDLKQRAISLERHLDARTNGWLSVVLSAIRNFAHMNSSEGAAAMTFYAFFSMFPLLALVVTVSSLMIPQTEIQQFLHRMLTPLFPFSADLIDQNILRFARQRGAVSVLGILGLFWSASNVFTILVHNINRAWRGTRVRNFLQRRLIALSLIMAIIMLLATALIAATIFPLLVDLEPRLMGEMPLLLDLLTRITPLLRFGITLVAFLFIYRYVPATRVRFSDAIWGAALVAVMWQITTTGLSIYLSSGFSRYDVIYGSIAAVVILMFWMYLNSIMILFGAHLTAAVTQRRTQPRSAPVITVRQTERPD